MAQLIAPGMCRYTINGQFAGRPVANILDLALTDLTAVTRAEACEQMAGDILNQWSDHILPLLADDYVALSVTWIDLDSEEGSVGERTSTDGSTWPETGGNVGAAASANVAMRVNKNVVASRGQRQGRMYLCGMAEAATDATNPNRLTAQVLTEINTAFEALRSGLEGPEDAENGVGQFTSSPNVIHTIGGVYSDRSRIISFSADPLLATQRRRLRG